MPNELLHTEKSHGVCVATMDAPPINLMTLAPRDPELRGRGQRDGARVFPARAAALGPEPVP